MPAREWLVTVLSVTLGPLASVGFAYWFNRKENRRVADIQQKGVLLQEENTDASVFNAHLEAFQVRVNFLEAANKECIKEIEQLRAKVKELETRSFDLLQRNFELERENSRLRRGSNA